MEHFICTKPFNSGSHSGARPCCYHLILQMGKRRPRKVANSIRSQIQLPVLVLSTMLVNSEWSVNPSGGRKIHVFKFLANAFLVSYTSVHIWTLFIWQILINPFTYVRHGLAFVLRFVIYRMTSRHFPRWFSQPVYKETGQEFLLLSPLPGWYPNQPNPLNASLPPAGSIQGAFMKQVSLTMPPIFLQLFVVGHPAILFTSCFDASSIPQSS